jgi:diguanylate cyclase (GGDEF)-like protein
VPRRTCDRLTPFLVAVDSAAVLALVWLGVTLQMAPHLAAPSLAVLVLCGLMILGEAKPIRLSRGGQDYDEVTISATFTLAAAMLGPLWCILAAQLLASAIDDRRRRKEFRRTAFNVAQLSLTTLGTRAVFTFASGRSFLADSAPVSPRDVAAGLLAGVAFFLINNGLTGTAVAFALNRPLLGHLRADVRTQLSTSGVLLSFGPVLVITAQFSLVLLPLTLLPIIAVYRSAALVVARERQARHDGLTRLPNRLLLLDVAAQALEQEGPAAVLLIDLDHFKEINDTLGHYVGDLLLIAVSERLRSTVREDDVVARLGGDEFAVLSPQLPNRAVAEDLADRVVTALTEPFMIDGVRLDVQASIGIALAPEHGRDAATLLQRADVALYDAKTHRGCFAFYDPDSDKHSVEKLALLGELREGVSSGQLRVHYQPKCDARTGLLLGLEALVRWEHPTRGLLYPDTFIPLAENSGLIRPLTMEVLDQALATARGLRDGGRALSVAVNLSVRLLTDLELPQKVASLLGAHGLPPETLTLEVTETSIMVDPSRTMTVLGLLRDLGVTLSIDDFGTGYSSLAYLRRLEAHELKIDKSFVFTMASNSDDAVIVRSTIDLGHSLGLRLVAEGVEDEGTWQMLQALGCDVIQGYHLARPMPTTALVDWMNSYERMRRGVDRRPTLRPVPTGSPTASG